MALNYQRKLYLILAGLLLFFMFNFITVLSFPSLNWIDLGMGNTLESVVIAVFSFASVCFVSWEIMQI